MGVHFQPSPDLSDQWSSGVKTHVFAFQLVSSAVLVPLARFTEDTMLPVLQLRR